MTLLDLSTEFQTHQPTAYSLPPFRRLTDILNWTCPTLGSCSSPPHWPSPSPLKATPSSQLWNHSLFLLCPTSNPKANPNVWNFKIHLKSHQFTHHQPLLLWPKPPSPCTCVTERASQRVSLLRQVLSTIHFHIAAGVVLPEQKPGQIRAFLYLKSSKGFPSPVGWNTKAFTTAYKAL